MDYHEQHLGSAYQMNGLKFTLRPGGCGTLIPAELSVRSTRSGDLRKFMPVSTASCGDRYHGLGAEHEFYHQCDKCYEKEHREAAAAAA